MSTLHLTLTQEQYAPTSYVGANHGVIACVCVQERVFYLRPIKTCRNQHNPLRLPITKLFEAAGNLSIRPNLNDLFDLLIHISSQYGS